MNIYTKCSNYASKSCPCALAEYGHCIMCSVCRGEEFCDCGDTRGYCIYNELKNNGGHALDQNHIVKCEVAYEKTFGQEYKYIRLRVPNADIAAFKRSGAFVFVRVLENTFYDVPISVIFEDYGGNSISLIIRMVGIKTQSFANLSTGDTVFLRGPYYNGLLGIKKIVNLRDDNALVLCRGIGLMPSLHVIGELRAHHNDIDIYLDPAGFDKGYLEIITELFELDFHIVSICHEDGELTPEVIDIMDSSIKRDVSLIHLGMSDYLISKCVNYIEGKYGRKIALSCINNVHMSCGEGVCGVCTKNRDAENIVHLCKEQVDVYEYCDLL